MTYCSPQFLVETVDGSRLGRLNVPYAQISDWLNFLVAPEYGAAIVSAEQAREYVSLYFEANEGLYLYLDRRLNQLAEAALVSQR